MSDVLFVGLGAMGAPIAANLARAHDVRLTGLDADPAAAPAGNVTWTRARDLAEGVRPDGVVVLCLPGIAQVETVARELIALEVRPRFVVDLSTSDPDRTRALAVELAGAGITLLDAPVARGRVAAAAGELLMMVGGPAEAFEELRPLLSAVASDLVHCGPVGAGQTVKILNNMVLLMNVHALTEAVAVAERHGLDVPTVVRVLRQGSAGSFALSGDPGRALETARFPAGKFAVDYAVKDISLARDLAGGLDLPGLRAAADLLARASADGYGADYYPAAVQVLLGRRLDAGYTDTEEQG
jgi:3-hydroxyisobutyrate dehydrogenase-like beta-hydroxyacid dehydrogenase